MKKYLFITLFIIFVTQAFCLTATVTPSVTSTITPTVTGGKAIPTATITNTPFLTKEELSIWNEKFNPIKKLNNVQPFLFINKKATMTENEIENYVKNNANITEINIIKTIVISKIKATKTVSFTPTKTITELIKK